MHSDDARWPTTLIAAPERSFAQLVEALAALGYARQPDVVPSTPLVAGEPELASFVGPAPLTYTFNPVASLRVLDAALTTPRQRGALARTLGCLDREALRALLGDPLPRRRLLGLWGLGAIEATELAPSTRLLTRDVEAVVAEAATEVTLRLERLAGLQAQIDGYTEQVAEAAWPVVEALRRDVPWTVPSVDDVDAAFVDVDVEVVAAHFRRRSPPVVSSGELLAVWSCPAVAFRGPSRWSSRFPGGYRDVAPKLNPDRSWVAWLCAAGEGDEQLVDGLVQLGDRFVWMPQPWRAVIP
ncbi:MAG: hypothetical protein KTR31_34450 [Myxococcales bacterium]|nr:hypothetical protein [Myxococcales bacterium]